ncbi:MAG: histidine phosphatase family protein [Pseudomonadota bacterium]
MIELILLRHAKSDWSLAGQPDIERPLNARGQRGAAAIGAWLNAAGLIPDEVFCSSATRTQETVARLGLGLEHQAQYTRALYHAEPEGILDVLAGATASRVLLVAHNPGIAELAHRLADVAPSHPRFADYPTAATTVLQFNTDWPKLSRVRGKVLHFVTPKDLIAD